MRKRRKILFVVESLSGGGAERVLLNLIKHIDRERFNVTVCPVVDTGVYSTEVRKYASVRPVLPAFPAEKSPVARFIWKLRHRLVHKWLPGHLVWRLFMPCDNDVEIAFVEGLTTKLVAASYTKARKLAWLHIDFAIHHWTASIFKDTRSEAETYRRFDGIVCVSQTVEQSFRNLLGTDLKTLVLHNPINADEIRLASTEPSAVPPGISDVVRLVSVGRLEQQKNFLMLIKAVKRLKDNGVRCELWLLGEGSQRAMLTRYISDNDLTDIVTMWGFVANPYPFIASADIFVCSSIAEGYSTAVTEAQILGIPVVTTPCSGMTEILGHDGKYGIISGYDDGSFYTALHNLVTDTRLLHRLKQNVSKRIEHFSIRRLMDSVENLLEQ